MKITILCVGKIRETFYKDAVAEYQKRLSKYCKLEILEVPDEKTVEKASEVVIDQIKAKEAERILHRLREDVVLCTLEITGKKYTSESFANLIEYTGITGKSHIVFVIGGSLGLHSSITERAQYSISFSDMTFPHQLMRVILTEQIYRAYRIMSGAPYHK